ncbi:uncharacterized protein LOC114255505 [Monomorium pharaonis]|uniref:uncharacterized protein LOC114255505 n=1 Tax=Monomorium pharaonis TaxID=307658 RepID=UPI0017479816|nr:uncharacterized protein LOC114255505 [Monomorium pharaonis]
MNVTEYRMRTLAFIMPPSEGPISGWKGCALRVTVLAVGFGIYILLFKKKNLSSGRLSLQRTPKIPIEPDDNLNTELKELSDDRSVVTDNGEVCPICLGEPKIGVRPLCGHLLCAECLANYCDVRITPAPPPCPLCRAPLNSVALACDFAILGPKMIDPDTIMVQDWIRKYNNHRGLVTPVWPFLTTRLVLFFNILTFFLIVGLLATRLQIISWEN